MAITAITATIAGICTEICQIPQAIKIHRERRAEGISLLMQIILTSGIFFWFLTGVLIMILEGNYAAGIPMVLSNGFCLVFGFYVLVMVILTKKEDKKK